MMTYGIDMRPSDIFEDDDITLEWRPPGEWVAVIDGTIFLLWREGPRTFVVDELDGDEQTITGNVGVVPGGWGEPTIESVRLAYDMRFNHEA